MYLKRRWMTRLFLMCSAALIGGTVYAQTGSEYDEPYRPQYHFSPPANWINDPNGLVYYEGEYHLFYQHHPDGLKWGPMHWGHAVSPDLVRWTNLPIALYPDAIGQIWSGGAVADVENTSGLVPGGGLVAIFSYHDQSQGVAYSTDKGRTWSMYAKNPVLPAVGKDFRDPKVFWYEPAQQWVMVIAAGDRAQIYRSPNLLNWRLASEFGEDMPLGLWEVPDLFPFTVDGQEKWVLLASLGGAPAGGSGVRYFIGEFDGTTFTADSLNEPLWLDYGPDNYAGTTWNDVPDGRRIYIGWMNNWMYGQDIPTMPWRGAMTIPRELSLRNTAHGLRLMQAPAAELEALRGDRHSWADERITSDRNLVADVRGTTLEIIAEFELEAGAETVFGFQVLSDGEQFTSAAYDARAGQMFVSRFNSGETGFNSNFAGFYQTPLTPVENRVRMRIFVDRSSVEVFGNDGEGVISAQAFPPEGADQLALFANSGVVRLVSLDVYALNGIW